MNRLAQSVLIGFGIALIACAALAQKSSAKGPTFDVADFNAKFETAQWLAVYDEVAWKTSDLVMAADKAEIEKLGKEWFCFQDDKGIWHAVYGKLEHGRYDIVFHYKVDPVGKIIRSTEKVDQTFLDTHARALSLAAAQLRTRIPADSPAFNQYIQRNTDNTFEVWMLPAFQTNGVAVYGGEAIYVIDSSGTKIVKDQSIFKDKFLGFNSEPPREIWLNYRELDKPTLGAIFFVWYYKSYFTKIYIDNSKSTSSLIRDDKVGYVWVHAEKDKSPETTTH
jgi:hypothetical protein